MAPQGRRPSLWLVLFAGLLAGGLAGALVGGVASLAVVGGYAPPPLAALIPSRTPIPTVTPFPTPTATMPPPTLTPLPTPTATPTATPRAALEDVVDRVGASVVTVVIRDRADGEAIAFGSGVVLLAPDVIATNHHVIERAPAISVITNDGRELAVTRLGSDFFSDLALLRVEEPLGLPALQLAVGEPVRVGERVFAIGSALGDFRNSVTSGIVSGVERRVWVDEAGFAYEGLIQTDAAINQGNSGGPLLDADGNVIGINTLVVRGGLRSELVEGLGFAIPARVVEEIGVRLLDDGAIERPFFGVSHGRLNPLLAARYDIPSERREGEVVLSVTPDSPAASAGVRQGDLLLELEGEPIDDQHPFLNLLFGHPIGATVEVRLLRGGEELTFEVTLVARERDG